MFGFRIIVVVAVAGDGMRGPDFISWRGTGRVLGISENQPNERMTRHEESRAEAGRDGGGW